MIHSSLPDACTPGAEGIFGPDRIFRYSYDKFDQVLTEERAVGTNLHQTYVTNTYAGRGVLTSQRDAKNNRTDLRYDANWRMNRRVYPSPSSPGSVNENDFNAYTHDNNGNVLTEIKRNGASITNEYDDNNRLTFKDLSDNTHSGDVSYDYDLRGLTLSSRFGSDAGQGVTNTFDGFGNLTAASTDIGGATRTLSYRYDANGNRTRVTHPDGWFFAYEFDSIDRVNWLGESASASPTASASTLLSLDYHHGGGRWNIFRPGGATTTYLQDNVKRLDSFTQNFAGTTNDLTNAFDYNPASQVIFLLRSNDLYAYAESQSRVGTYVPNGLNQYTNIAGQAIAYDDNGNLTSDGSMTYTYDMENRLVATSEGAASSFTYDPLGRLFQVTIAGATRQFLYDGDALVAEYSGSAMTRRYVHGDQVDEPWVQYDSATVGASYRRYLHADHQGSIIAQSSNTGGVVFRNAYDAYGIPATGNTGRFGYTGQAWLPELGLYHYKARMYHPKLGRFLQTDPIFYADDMNMYAYVGGDPMNKTDPTGRQQRPKHRDDVLYDAAERAMEKQQDLEEALGNQSYWLTKAQEAFSSADYRLQEEYKHKAKLEQSKYYELYYELSGTLPADPPSSDDTSERSEQPEANASAADGGSRRQDDQEEERAANRVERSVREQLEQQNNKPIELPLPPELPNWNL